MTTTDPQTATERAREIIRATLVWNLHAMFGESHDKATEEVIAALHEAGLVIVDTTWHEAAGICMELYDFEQEKAP